MTEYKYSCNIDDGTAAVIGPSAAQSVTDVGQHTEHWAPDKVPNIGHTHPQWSDQTLSVSARFCALQLIMFNVAVNKICYDHKAH